MVCVPFPKWVVYYCFAHINLSKNVHLGRICRVRRYILQPSCTSQFDLLGEPSSGVSSNGVKTDRWSMIIHPKLISLINLYQLWDLSNLSAQSGGIWGHLCFPAKVQKSARVWGHVKINVEQIQAWTIDLWRGCLLFLWEMYGKCMVNVWKSCAETPRT